MSDVIGRPTQCPECYAWIVPGATHSCTPPPDLRELWRAILGANVKTRREALGLTQAHVANVVGVSRGSIANLERGQQDPPLSRVYALAEALRCSPAEIIEP